MDCQQGKLRSLGRAGVKPTDEYLWVRQVFLLEKAVISCSSSLFSGTLGTKMLRRQMGSRGKEEERGRVKG